MKSAVRSLWISLDLNDCTRLEGQVNRAIYAGVLELPSAHEPHDLQAVSRLDRRYRPIGLAGDRQIAFHRHARRIDCQPDQQAIEKKSLRDAPRFAVYNNFNRLCFSTFHMAGLTPRFADHYIQ